MEVKICGSMKKMGGGNIIDKTDDYSYGDVVQTGVGKEMAFEQKL